MSVVCPGCKNQIVPTPDTASSTDIVCPKCKMEFMIAKPGQKNLLEQGCQLGGYEIVRLIGSGGMGKVYEAVQLSLERKVALKVIEAEVAGSDVMVKRFLQEVRATASLEHTGIVTVFEASQQDNLLYLAMELVNGVSLDSLLKASRGPIDEAVAWNYALQVCDAMNYAWKYQQLLHRDIKPANIMVLENDHIRICDLGIAKRGTDEVDISREGMAIGTPHYMSPEQGQGLSNLDFRTDIYSLGASLYHLTTGRVPFPGVNAITVITSHIVDELADPRIINPDLSDPSARLIMLMMGKKPKDRHPSWEALREDITRVLDGQMPVFEPEPAKPLRTPAVQNEVIVPAKDARKGKRTMVDLNIVRNELKLNAERHNMARSGWQLVRVGYLTVSLVALVGAVAFQYREVFLPEIAELPEIAVAPQILLLDDGTNPAPPEKGGDAGIAFSTQRVNIFSTALSMLEKGAVGEENAVDKTAGFLLSNNETVLSLSRYCASENNLGDAIRLNQYILAHPDSCSPQDLGKACNDLVDYLYAAGKKDEIQPTLQTALKMADVIPEPYAASLYIGYAEHHWQEGRSSAGCGLLSSGLKRFAKNGRVKAAEMVAVCLIRYAQHHEDPVLLKTTCVAVKERLPGNCDAVKLASRCLEE